MMNFKIIILAFCFGLTCFSACKKDGVEPTQTTTTTTTPVSSPEILGFPASISLNVGDTYEMKDYIESKRCLVPMFAMKCIADASVVSLSTTGISTLTGLAPGRTIVTLSFQDLRAYIVVEVTP